MEAYHHFNTIIYKWVRSVGLAQGHDILRAAWTRWTLHTVLALGTAVSIPFMYTWTIYNFNGDLAMKAFGYLGIGFQIAVKALFPLIARTSINDSIALLKQIYIPNLTTSENGQIFNGFAKTLRACAKLIASNYTICVVSFYASPAIIYLVTGSVDPIMPIFLPGTSPDSHWGYAISTVYHVFAIFSAGCVYIFFDVIFAVQILHVILMSNILTNKIRAINGMAAEASNSCRLSMLLNFRNVLAIHNEMLLYVNNLSQLYFYPLVIVIVFATASIAVNIFASFALNLVPISLYVMITGELVELSYYCIAGTVIDVSYANLYSALVTSDWNLYPKSSQNAMIFLLAMAKKPNNMKVAGIMPLNLHTYVLLLRHIYSFAMVLHNIL